MALCLISSPASASTWYVNGVSGSDSNNCMSATTACKTIGHAISLASSGDSIMVAAATYTENLVIGFSLRMIGSGARTTIIDGGHTGTVVAISSISAVVNLSNLTIRNGSMHISGGGISNSGTLTINNCTITGNLAFGGNPPTFGGGIANGGRVTINNSAITGNIAQGIFGAGAGGGIANRGTATVNNSTLSGNSAVGAGGGIVNSGSGNLKINNSTISGNKAPGGGGIANAGAATLQNSIVANNSGGNCFHSVTSKGYNLSSDGSCNFNGPGDLKNTNPMLGPLQYNGGPTKTMALPSGSRAIDAGNPSGCTDGLGHLLKTDQRGKPRPDTEDTGGCDMGAYERQSD
jgi:hypothetical protein